MKKILSLAVLLAAAYFAWSEADHALPGTDSGTATARSASGELNNRALHQVIAAQRSDVQVKGQGRVVKLLPDDNKGSRHQRFLLDVGTRGTVLVAHNIDLAPKITQLRKGDTVEFYGEYEWNDLGGVVHWTHHDPGGRHVDGWLRHEGRTYQ